jgi:hypothetical protein
MVLDITFQTLIYLLVSQFAVPSIFTSTLQFRRITRFYADVKFGLSLKGKDIGIDWVLKNKVNSKEGSTLHNHRCENLKSYKVMKSISQSGRDIVSVSGKENIM